MIRFLKQTLTRYYGPLVLASALLAAFLITA